MNAAGQKPKKAPETGTVKFATAESFGLFMEGLRSLKKYTEESEKAQPDQTVLQQRLEDALTRLGKCEIAYPSDPLPLYSLGLALTMKNQNLYAEMLLNHGNESPRLMRSAAHGAAAPSSPDKKARRRRKKGGLPGVYYAPTEYLPPPPDREWPHLRHAGDLFREIMEKGPAMMRDAAAYNLAHVCSKLGKPENLSEAETLLKGIEKPSPTVKPAEPKPPMTAKPGKPGFFSRIGAKPRQAVLFLASLFRRKTPDESEERQAAQERLMTWLQSQTLLASVTARRDLKAMARQKTEFYPGLATMALKNAKDAIDKAFTENKDLPAVKKTDLEADYWTKAGFLAYQQAFAMSPDNIEFDAYLDEAEGFLRRALDLKQNWNPAQIYLAQVLQAQGRIDKAQEYVEAVIGRLRAQTTPPATPPPTTSTAGQTSTPPATATPDQPQEPKK